uniref:Golgi resident protein GCP60 n=1 Tax=Lygus hesperus TaxID=30085 RepID=A0A0A9ZAD3_LYGHE
MAASGEPGKSAPPADPHFDRLSIDGSDEFKTDTETSKYDEDFIRKWGFKLRDLYKMALMFYKEKEGKAVSLSYQDKLKLVALTKQVTIGKINPDTCPPLGVLDVIGRDRRLAWQSLGDLSVEDAMVEFVELIDDRCPLFRPYAQAHRANMETRRALEQADELKEAEEKEKQETENEATQTPSLDDGDTSNMNVANIENHKKSIMEALNRQTYGQFKAYVEQHFPGDTAQQEQMMTQLQEQHYQQYIEQMMLRLKNTEQEEYLQYNGTNGHLVYPAESEEEAPSSMSVDPASLWTRKDIKEFKDSIRKEGGDSVIKVGHGETVTVRVPTNEEGTCLFWEFATDYYDIGFGVYFEWTKSPTNQVSVHVSESEDDEDYPNDEEDDDDDDEEEEEFGLRTNDIERGMSKMNRYNLDPIRPPLTEILPVRRRDCMEQVYAGSHAYPGTGVYLLKFDNSYSLWRSKTLYYKVYYTR